jgi:deoxyribose-phosphate aldolase
MEDIRKIAIDVLGISDPKPCKCGGQHQVCLECRVCRANDKDQLASDFQHLAQYIDHTILKAEASEEAVKTICEEADYYLTKSVCVNPLYVNLVSESLEKVLTCSVVGFPLSNSLTQTIVAETSQAIQDGANEIDMVIKVNWLKDKKYSQVLAEIRAISETCADKGALLKVIFENCLLTKEEIIIASLLSKKAGAEFIKTSTGFNKSGAAVEDVKLMRDVVGPKIGVKAAGGIRNRETAIQMLKAGANRIGASATKEILKDEYED